MLRTPSCQRKNAMFVFMILAISFENYLKTIILVNSRGKYLQMEYKDNAKPNNYELNFRTFFYDCLLPHDVLNNSSYT